MRNLIHHPPEYRRIRPHHYLIDLAQSQPPDDVFVLLGSADGAVHQFDLDRACHYIFSTARPRISATLFLSRSDSSATIVAFTTLCGLRRPIDLVSTLGIPQAVITARTAPPAITPVPSGAGLSSTWELENSPSTRCGIVVLSTLMRRRFFLAASIPLRIAEGTSLALPTPQPTTLAEGSPIT